MSTVSPTFARELAHKERWGMVSTVFRKRSDRVVGILNGIDTKAWNPITDESLAVRYDRTSVISAKARNKAALVTELGLTGGAVPLVAFIGRLDALQKGVDILLGSLRTMLPGNGLHVVILGTGHKEVVSRIVKFTKAHSSTCAFIPRFDDRLARRIYAGADIMVVPSKFEPCGLIQMISMRYGTIPVVRKTGGLADSVIDGGTGFTFGPYSASALTLTLTRAIHIYQKNQKNWHALVTRVMRQDFSWETSARSYVALYKRLTGNRPSDK
jgi:starch synthase